MGPVKVLTIEPRQLPGGRLLRFLRGVDRHFADIHEENVCVAYLERMDDGDWLPVIMARGQDHSEAKRQVSYAWDSYIAELIVGAPED